MCILFNFPLSVEGGLLITLNVHLRECRQSTKFKSTSWRERLPITECDMEDLGPQSIDFSITTGRPAPVAATMQQCKMVDHRQEHKNTNTAVLLHHYTTRTTSPTITRAQHCLQQTTQQYAAHFHIFIELKREKEMETLLKRPF